MKEKVFREYIDEFKKLPLEERKKLTIDKIKDILVVIDEFIELEDLNNELLLTADVNKIDSDDEFVNAIYVYMNTIQESLAIYLENNINKKGD